MCRYILVGFRDEGEFIIVNSSTLETKVVSGESILNKVDDIINLELINGKFSLIGMSISKYKEAHKTCQEGKFGGILTIIKEYIKDGESYGYAVADGMGNVKKLSLSDTLKAADIWGLTNGRKEGNRIVALDRHGYIKQNWGEEVSITSKQSNWIEKNAEKLRVPVPVCNIGTKELYIKAGSAKYGISIKNTSTRPKNAFQSKVKYYVVKELSNSQWTEVCKGAEVHIVDIVSVEEKVRMIIIVRNMDETDDKYGYGYEFYRVEIRKGCMKFVSTCCWFEGDLMYLRDNAVTMSDINKLTIEDLQAKLDSLYSDSMQMVSKNNEDKVDGRCSCRILGIIGRRDSKWEKMGIIVTSFDGTCRLIDTYNTSLREVIESALNAYMCNDRLYYEFYTKKDMEVIKYINDRMQLGNVQYDCDGMEVLDIMQVIKNEDMYTLEYVSKSIMSIYKLRVNVLKMRYINGRYIENIGSVRRKCVRGMDSREFMALYENKILKNPCIYDLLGNRVSSNDCYMVVSSGMVVKIDISRSMDNGSLLEVGDHLVPDKVIGLVSIDNMTDTFTNDYNSACYKRNATQQLKRFNSVFRLGLAVWSKMYNIELCNKAKLRDMEILDYVLHTEIDGNELRVWIGRYMIGYNISMLRAYMETENNIWVSRDKQVDKFIKKTGLMGMKTDGITEFGILLSKHRYGFIDTKNGIRGIEVYIGITDSYGYIEHLILNNDFDIIEKKARYGSTDDIHCIKLIIDKLEVHKGGCHAAALILRMNRYIKVNDLIIDDDINAELFNAMVARFKLNNCAIVGNGVAKDKNDKDLKKTYTRLYGKVNNKTINKLRRLKVCGDSINGKNALRVISILEKVQ